ncbi:MAG: hypothetical protein ACPGU9_05080 [Flavobacteriaceae bacterium]
MFLSLGFSQCTAVKISKTIQVQNTDTYYQHWVAGVRGGGSGTNVFISKAILNHIKKVDSMYYMNKFVRIEQNETHYIGYFKGDANTMEDRNIALKTDTTTANESSTTIKQSPFKLQKGEAVISYSENGQTKYLKLTDIKQRPMIPYPSAPKH